MTRSTTITGFCEVMNISRGFFYKLMKSGHAPRVMQVGSKKLISDKAADDWQQEREMEAETRRLKGLPKGAKIR